MPASLIEVVWYSYILPVSPWCDLQVCLGIKTKLAVCIPFLLHKNVETSVSRGIYHRKIKFFFLLTTGYDMIIYLVLGLE